MPEHLHLIVFPVTDTADVSALLSHFTRPTSYRIRMYFQEMGSPWLDLLTIRERPGKTTFRFWQEGSGYDRLIDNPQTLEAAIHYVHENPVRRGLCKTADQWPWSSWRHYFAVGDVNEKLPQVHGLPQSW